MDTIMKILIAVIVIAGLCSRLLYCDEPILPEVESRILNEVAFEYCLTEDQTKLLLSIRKIENGGPGIEMGIINTEARRYKGDFKKSLRLQAQWAAGTIKKRYDGDLEKFANRYCPVGAKNDPSNLNKNWLTNCKYYMNKF